jgi:Fe-S-cluster-containing hydrogenase component 2
MPNLFALDGAGVTTQEDALMSSAKKRFGLVFHPEKCTLCLECEKACIKAHPAVVASGKPRIQVTKEGDKPKALMCVHCDTCPPSEVCPSALFEFHNEGKYWTLDEHRCFACMACIPRCPFDGVFFEGAFGVETAYSCDLCAGDPACVKVCAPGALTLSKDREE